MGDVAALKAKVAELEAELTKGSGAKASGELWASPMTTCSRRAIAACIEAGVEFKFVPIHLPKVEHKLPEFVAINPNGKVPAWRDSEGFNLFESRAIARHVAEGSSLIPPTAKARALMEQWLWVDEGTFKPAVMPILYMKVIKKAPLDEGKVAQCRTELEPILDQMEAALTASGLDYLACDTFTLADLTYCCYFQLFPPAGLSDLLEPRPTLAAWVARCLARPSWQATLALDFIEERKLPEDPLGREKPWSP